VHEYGVEGVGSGAGFEGEDGFGGLGGGLGEVEALLGFKEVDGCVEEVAGLVGLSEREGRVGEDEGSG
jgi:hypothetical protein